MAAGVDGYNFTLIDKKTIEYLQGLKKTVNVAKDYSWNNKLIGAELLQGVLGGESIPNIAGRLRNVEKKMEKSAVKNARTMTTAAQNRGRLDGMAQARADGVIMQKMWVATHDGRTRDSHAEIDGEQQDQDDAFTNGLMFPGDTAGEASEVYNCRCTMVSVVKGFRSSDGTVYGVDTELENYSNEANNYWEGKEKKATKENRLRVDEYGAMKGIQRLRSISVDENAKSCNPTYNERSFGSTTNCAYTSTAFEARMRGYDVVANERKKGEQVYRFYYDVDRNKGIGSFTDCFDGIKYENVGAKRTDKIVEAVESKMGGYGDGSRAIVFVEWKRSGGHYFNAINDGGKIRFIDAQDGTLDCKDYFQNAKPSSVALFRVDNLEFTDYIRRVIH